jgi:hypothetical protein
MVLANIVITIFWFIVASVHVFLAIKHFLWSRESFNILPNRPTIGTIMGVPLNIRESVEDINSFINRLNQQNRQSNVAQFWGYIAGLVASLIGFILSLTLLIA